MDYLELRSDLANTEAVATRSFELLHCIARFVNEQNTHNEGRDLVIRALAVADTFSETEREILASLVRSVGLFPYMTPFLKSADLDDYIAYELHRADNMDGDIIFHSLQAKIYHQLMSGANVVLSASTSVGKSLVIDALVASGKYKKIVIVVPTIALIDETRRRLIEKFGTLYSLITHPSQSAREDHPCVYVLTQERVLQRPDLADTQLLIIDEFYKVNIGNGVNSDRAVDLNLAFHKIARKGAQFYLLGPNIQSISGLSRYEYHFIPSEFSTVSVDVVNYNLPFRGDARKLKLKDLIHTVDGPTIIYCQSPASATTVANFLVQNGNLPEISGMEYAIEWMAKNYDPDWIVARALKHGIGIHHGGVPRALQQYFIKLFNARNIRYLICTSTIIEGVNTVAKNVIIYDRRKSKNILDHFTYKNIEGRAGRMREYFIGRVFSLETPPDDVTFSVDFPIGNQNFATPMSLLLDLENSDLNQISRERIKSTINSSTLSLETLRANRHTPIPSQENIARRIRSDLLNYEDALKWKGIPEKSQFQAVCNLIFDYLEGDFLPDYKITSAASLAWHINTLRFGKDISVYIHALISRKRDDESPGEIVERGLKFIRNIVCHRFPRDLMVISTIQHQILSEHGATPGDYALFAEMIENIFMPSSLFALDEYGVPVQTAQKLSSHLATVASVDDVLGSLARLDLSLFELSHFEIELLNDVRELIIKSIMNR